MNLFTNKKGDLSLSVNAIVVLVIAIIFLGLAIGFTTKLIGSSKDKLLSGVENVDISTPATSENQMVFDGKLEVKTGGKQPIKVSFYNNAGTTLTNAKPTITNCISDVTGFSWNNANPQLSFIALNSSVQSYQEQRFQSILSSASGTPTGSYLCTISMGGASGASSFSKQVAIGVVS